MRQGQPIETYPIKQHVPHGITFANDLGNEWVSEYETREAARWAYYNWTAFNQLDYDDRCATVAQYRLSFMIDAHVSDAVTSQPLPGV